MKGLRKCAFLALLPLCLAACGPGETPPETLPPAPVEEPAAPPEDVPAPEAAPIAVPEGCAALTAEELDWFQTDFFGGTADTWVWEPRNPRPQFLTSLYDRPEEIDLAELLYMGGPEAGEIGDAERQELLDLGFPTMVPWQKYTTAAIDAFLQSHLGLTLAETRGTGMDQLTYLPAYDAYYSHRSDVNSGPVDLEGGWKAPDGTVTLVHLGGCQVVLEPQGGDGYHFVSHTRPLTAAELDWFQHRFFSGPGDETLSPANAFLTCAYDRPEDIDLWELLYNGLSREDPQAGPERAALLAAGFSPELDWQKSTAAQLADLLETYAGLSPAEMAGRGLDQLVYLPEQDAYYTDHNDTNAVLPTLVSGRWTAGGLRLVYDRNWGEGRWEATLVRRDGTGWDVTRGRWQFVSNRQLS